jgi:hypothetical protein
MGADEEEGDIEIRNNALVALYVRAFVHSLVEAEKDARLKADPEKTGHLLGASDLKSAQ